MNYNEPYGKRVSSIDVANYLEVSHDKVLRLIREQIWHKHTHPVHSLTIELCAYTDEITLKPRVMYKMTGAMSEYLIQLYQDQEK